MGLIDQDDSTWSIRPVETHFWVNRPGRGNRVPIDLDQVDSVETGSVDNHFSQRGMHKRRQTQVARWYVPAADTHGGWEKYPKMDSSEACAKGGRRKQRGCYVNTWVDRPNQPKVGLIKKWKGSIVQVESTGCGNTIGRCLINRVDRPPTSIDPLRGNTHRSIDQDNQPGRIDQSYRQNPFPLNRPIERKHSHA